MLFKPDVPYWVLGARCWVFSVFLVYLLRLNVFGFIVSHLHLSLLCLLLKLYAYDVYGCSTLSFFFSLDSGTMVCAHCAYTKYYTKLQTKIQVLANKNRFAVADNSICEMNIWQVLFNLDKYVRQYNPFKLFLSDAFFFHRQNNKKKCLR